ncbi:hypothetical protein LPJ57_007676 [Coemansia sp. RSA 486]|nr:hypothetical protein LPJ57_007676 [Coemansia sp. RSA 486]
MLGSAIGLAIAQSVLQNQLAPRIDEVLLRFPDSKDLITSFTFNQAVIWAEGVPTDVHESLIEAYVKSMHAVYLIFLSFGGAALIISLFVKNIPLRKTLGASAPE